MKFILQTFDVVLASVNLLMILPVLYRLRQPTSPVFWMIKVFTSALSPLMFLIGLLTAILGLILNSLLATALGSCAALLFLIHIVKITRGPDPSTGFEQAFGTQWESRISQERKTSFLSNRYVVRLPNSSEPIFNPNISFYTIPDTSRQLLCDIWQPPKTIKPSGLAFIYLHGSAWYLLDKDLGTRTFFSHLTKQGHVIMDVAYRLFPETDLMGMVQDAKHAIAWMKANATLYGINPDRIVIGGGSAGGHISLLAAYTNGEMQFTSTDLEEVDTSVRAVISLYGPTDLRAVYYYTAQDVTNRLKKIKQKEEGFVMPSWIQKRMGENYHRLGFDKNVEPGQLVPMLGGNPDEKPGLYSLFSPIAHIHKGCPPTLLIEGKHDIITSVKSVRHLQVLLKEAGVQVVTHLIPQTDHAFDLILSVINPAAHNAYYDVERFLAMMAL